MVKYYNRKTKQIEQENSNQEKLLNFLYHTPIGRFCLWSFVARPWVSKLRGVYQNSHLSKKDIIPFIEKNHIKNIEQPIDSFECFNDFFARTKTLDIKDKSSNCFVSPADSKLQIFDITDELKLKIKQSVYDVSDILDDEKMAKKFSGGQCAVFRLCVDDYHRYHFVDNGALIFHKRIKGELHTVRPVSEKYNVFARNSREVSIIRTANFGDIAYIEIGALLVGKINNHNKITHRKFEEKGYFEFGGSTIVLLLQNKIEFDKDIVEKNQQGLEVKVFAGETIGVKRC